MTSFSLTSVLAQKLGMLVFEQEHLSRTIFARKTCHIFHLHYGGKLVKEKLF